MERGTRDLLGFLLIQVRTTSIVVHHNLLAGSAPSVFREPWRKSGGSNLAYDANGSRSNLWPKHLLSYYDLYGQLKTVQDSVNFRDYIKFGYNTAGQRVWKHYHYEEDTCTVPIGPLGLLEYQEFYLPLPYGLAWRWILGAQPPPSVPCWKGYDEWTYYLRGKDGKVLAEYESLDTNSQGFGPFPKRQYIYAGNQRIAMLDESGVYFYLNDHLGSARIVTDMVATVKDRYVYSAFGSAESGQITSTNQAYRYTGKPLDEELNLGLYYYGARYYDAVIGRFTSVDPLRGH